MNRSKTHNECFAYPLAFQNPRSSHVPPTEHPLAKAATISPLCGVYPDEASWARKDVTWRTVGGCTGPPLRGAFLFLFCFVCFCFVVFVSFVFVFVVLLFFVLLLFFCFLFGIYFMSVFLVLLRFFIYFEFFWFGGVFCVCLGFVGGGGGVPSATYLADGTDAHTRAAGML